MSIPRPAMSQDGPVRQSMSPERAEAVLARNAVTVSGSGEPALVFAHGYGCDQSMWRFVAPAFQDRHRIVLLDHVGSGRSDLKAYDPARYDSLEAYADDLLEVIEALGLREVVFVGHSVSATIGILAANRAPERFSKLVLVGPSPRYLDDPAAGYTGGFTREDVEGLLEVLDANHLGWSSTMAPVIMGNPDRPELAEELKNSFCRTDPAIARHFARVTFLADNRADLDRLTTPALILQCTDDAIAPQAVGDYVLAHAPPGSRLIVMAATGHCPHMSAPRDTIEAIRAFL